MKSRVHPLFHNVMVGVQGLIVICQPLTADIDEKDCAIRSRIYIHIADDNESLPQLKIGGHRITSRLTPFI